MIKYLIAAAIMAATATTASAQVLNKDHSKIMVCVMIGENASLFAKGRMLGAPESIMRTKVVNPTTDPLVKYMLSESLAAVYMIDEYKFNSMGEMAPTMFRDAAAATCINTPF